MIAGPRGIEPRPTVLETDVLPLNYRPYTDTVTKTKPVGKVPLFRAQAY